MPFAPTDIAGCLVWLEADSGVYTDAGSTPATDGQTVQQWNDQSGNGNHATQATSGKRPVYRTNVCNGKPALRFDNSDDSLTSITKSSGALSLFVVYNQRSLTNAARRAINGGNNWLIGPYNGQHNTYMGGFIGNGTSIVVPETFVSMCITQNGTTGKVYRGNVDKTTGNAGGFPGVINIGGGTGGFVEPLDGDIVAVVIYDTVLSSTDRASVFNYLAERWNVEGLAAPTEPVSGVTGCLCWLSADAETFKDAAEASLADGDAVYGIYDRTGRGNNFIQAASTKRPLYKTTIVNGKPVLRFDGTDDVIFSSLYLVRPYTCFIVYAKKGASGGNARTLAGSGDWFIGTGAAKYRHYAVTGYVSDTLAETVDAFVLGTATNNGTASSFHVDETDRTTLSTPIGNPLQISLGSSGDLFNGDIAEVLIYNSALSAGDRRKVWDYLGPKYGLFASSAGGAPTFRVMGVIG